MPGCTTIHGSSPVNSGHISDEDLELYCLGRSPDARLPRLEEHILLCPSCQRRCQDLQTYLDTIRRVLREERRSIQ